MRLACCIITCIHSFLKTERIRSYDQRVGDDIPWYIFYSLMFPVVASPIYEFGVRDTLLKCLLFFALAVQIVYRAGGVS